MKKLFLLAALLCLSTATTLAKQPKYVFYFIGDGMGLNQVNAAESYLAEVQGRIGIEPLCFGNFPYTTFATSYSHTNGVTDSAAGGTALACGKKTYNGALGVDPEKNPIQSIAYWAQQSGKRIGVCTSTSYDHATPAAFYAHVPDRNMYHQIGHQMAASGYDFFGGADFRQCHQKHDGADDCNLHQVVRDAGYTLAYGYDEARQALPTAQKLVMTQTREGTRQHGNDLAYAIDRRGNDLSLKQIVEVGLDFLMKDAKKGFFFMIEGGNIDHAGHADDGATNIQETIDLDEAVKVAYAFYKQHPSETLIVVTADHETGGMGLGTGAYSQNLKAFQHQTVSVSVCSRKLGALRRPDHVVTWDEAKQVLDDCYGLFSKLNINERDAAYLQRVFDEKFKKEEKQNSMYQSDDALASEARIIMQRIAQMAWSSYSHSNGYVPVFAIGVGAERFHGRLNNIDIPLLIAQSAGYKVQ